MAAGRCKRKVEAYLVVLVVVRRQVLLRMLHRDASLVREVGVAVVHVGVAPLERRFRNLRQAWRCELAGVCAAESVYLAGASGRLWWAMFVRERELRECG